MSLKEKSLRQTPIILPKFSKKILSDFTYFTKEASERFPSLRSWQLYSAFQTFVYIRNGLNEVNTRVARIAALASAAPSKITGTVVKKEIALVVSNLVGNDKEAV